MNDMEKCFYEPAELSVVDEGKGRSLVKAKGSPYKLGFLVAQGADGIFKSLNDAEAVDAMERAIVGTIRIMAMRRKAEFEKGTDAFDMNGGFNAVRDEGALKEILKSIFGKQCRSVFLHGLLHRAIPAYLRRGSRNHSQRPADTGGRNRGGGSDDLSVWHGFVH